MAREYPRTSKQTGPVERLRYVRDRLPVARAATVVKEVCEKFGVCEQTARRDVVDVRSEWSEYDKERSRELRSEMIERLMQIYQEAMKSSDHKAAVSALRQICKVTGLEEKTVRTVLGADEGVTALVEALQLTPAQRQARMAELEARAGEAPEGPSYAALLEIAQEAASWVRQRKAKAPRLRELLVEVELLNPEERTLQ